MRIAALYIRVSTDDQVEYSPDAQKRMLLEYASKHDIVVSNEYIFLDDGISGKKADKRPQFQHMIGLAKSKDRPFDIILVWKYSRFARNQEESIVYKSLLKKNNVDVISISEPIIDGPFGTLIERIIEWMDEYYSIRLSEEVKRGMTEKALRGEYQAGSPFGYDMINGSLVINEDEANIIREIFDMYQNQSHSFFSIARHLNNIGIKTTRGNTFENRTVKYIIQNPVYKGFARWNPNGKVDLREQKHHKGDTIIKKSDHQPIICEDIWNAANEKLLNEYRPLHARSYDLMSHWLSGIIFCNTCGGPLVSGGSSGGFQCSNYSKGKCKESHYVKYQKIEQAILNKLKELADLGNFDYEIIPSGTFQKKEAIATRIKKLEQKELRIRDAYINGIDSLDEYKNNKARIESERIELSRELNSIKDIEKSEEIDNIMVTKLKSAYNILSSDADKNMKNRVARSIIAKIIYTKSLEKIDIYLFYS